MRLRGFYGLSLRNLRARPQRTLLTAVGIVLGVGIVFGVLTLSNTMSSTFSQLFTRAYGAADLVITAAGGTGGFEREVVEEVRGEPGVEYAAPRLSRPSSIVLSRATGSEVPQVQGLRLFGVEPESAELATGFELAEGRFPESGAEITLDRSTVQSLGLGIGDTLRITTNEGVEEVGLVGLLRAPGGSLGGVSFGMAPLPYVQEIYGKPGEVSGMVVEAESEGAIVPLKTELRQGLGESLEVQRSSTNTRQVTGQLQGFRIALLFFAGTSLFVGAFLVFNALSMTVLERTRELGMLRAQGATRAMISRSVILEAAALGVVGSIAGVLLGYGMARGLVFLFGKAFTYEISDLDLSLFALVAAVVVGVVVTVLAALYPAIRAGRISPVEAMRAGGTSSGRSSRRRMLPLVLGILLVGAGAPWTYYLASNLSTSLDGLVYASGIAGVIATFLGVSLVIPSLVRPMAALFSPVLRLLFGVEGRMAATNSTRNRGRTALTASALMVGVSLVISFAALGGSVLGTIGDYLQDSLGADFVVEPAQRNVDLGFSPELADRLAEIPGVEETTGAGITLRRGEGGGTPVFGVEESYAEIFNLSYSDARDNAFSKLQDGAAIIGRQLAESKNLRVGSTVELPSASGTAEYPVAGIVRNDLLGGGTGVYISRESLREDFNIKADEFLAVKAAPGSDRGAIESSIQEILGGYPQLALYSNAEYKAEIESQFNQQYAFFYAIMAVAVAVSAFGVVNTLSMSVFERTREIGVLRAVGATRLQVGRLIVDEGVVISLIGCILGVAVGSVLGYLFVQGSSAGGFEVSFYYPELAALAALAAGLFIGVSAGLLPARAAARTNIVEAVQYE